MNQEHTTHDDASLLAVYLSRHAHSWGRIVDLASHPHRTAAASQPSVEASWSSVYNAKSLRFLIRPKSAPTETKHELLIVLL